jgi:hypothetical protein
VHKLLSSLRQLSPYFLVLLKVLSLVVFLVEDACVGDFISLCLSLLDFYAKVFFLALPSFASPSRSAAAIELVLHLLWEGFITCFG